MKSLNGSVLRCIFAIVLGLVLVLWPEAAVTYLVITIGICFIIPGLFSLLNYFTREKVEGEPSPMFPIDGAGSILFGAWLVIMPQFFVSILMYVLGALLVLAGAQQLISLVSARKWSTVSYVFYIIPSLILITGIMILAYPFGAAANTFVIFGVACLIYGISELINCISSVKDKRKMEYHPLQDLRYSIGEIPICFLKNFPKVDWSEK